MFILGLTGSIATGKSTILKMFEGENIAIISADDIVHNLYKNEALTPIAKIFPKTLINNRIDRKILSKILLAMPELIKKLEEIVHPLVRSKIDEFINQQKKLNTKMIVLEIPLLFESNAKYPINAIAVTYCSDEIQKQRALEREGMSEEKLQLIISRQMPQSEKKDKADFIIDTSKSIDDSLRQVKQIINQCLNSGK